MQAGHVPHVLHVVRTLGIWGGMEQAMRRVIIATAARGLRHSVLLLSDQQKHVLDFDGHAEIYREFWPPRDPRMIRGIWRHIEALAPTVVHVRNWSAWPDVAMARLPHRPRPPLIWSFHGVEAAGPLPRRRRLMLRGLAAVTTRMFAVSEAAREDLVQSSGLARSRIEVIRNGVDLARYAPGPAALARARLVVGTVGRLEPVKNQALLLDAVAELVRRGHDVEVALAGMGSCEPTLRAQAARLGIAERARFAGHVSDVPSFMRGLDVFVLPSDSEANPNALLEAMATQLACVGTAVGSVPDLLEHGRSGMVVPPRDPDALADAVELFLLSKELRAELGGRARRHVAESFSFEVMIDAYERLYRAPRSR